MAAILRRTMLATMCGAFALYTAYVYTSGTWLPVERPLDRGTANGLALFQEKNCVACHQFYGLGGYMGPDLTNVISAPDKGPDYARAFIESGTAKMPDFGLSEAQVDDLVRFLEFVDASGRYRPENAEIRWNGTVDYDPGRDRQ